MRMDYFYRTIYGTPDMSNTKQDELKLGKSKAETPWDEGKEVGSAEDLKDATERLNYLQRNRSAANQKELNELSEKVRAYTQANPAGARPESKDTSDDPENKEPHMGGKGFQEKGFKEPHPDQHSAAPRDPDKEAAKDKETAKPAKKT